MTLSLLWRAAPYIAAALAVIVIIGSVWAWAHGKDRQIASLRANRVAAITWALRAETDYAVEHVNLAGARRSIDLQNASLAAAERQNAATVQALARNRQEADRAAVATDRRVASWREREATLRARGDLCIGALDLVRGAR